MTRVAGRTAAVLGRLLHVAGVCVLGLLVLLAVGAAVLGIRLSQGPVDVAWAVRAALRFSGASQVRVGEATLAWAGWHGGADSPVRLTIRRLAVDDADGRPVLSAQEGSATLSASGLLAGNVQPGTAELNGVHLRLRHDGSGEWHLLVDAAGPAPGGPPTSSGAEATLDKLRRLSLHDATVDVDDDRLGPWRLTAVDVDLTRDDAGGLHGSAAAVATLGNVSTHASVHATVQPGGTSRLDFSAGPVDPATVAAVGGPALAGAAALDAQLSVSGRAVLDKDARPVSVEMTASAGQGRLNVGGGAVPFTSLAAAGSAEWADGMLQRVPAARLEATVPSPGAGPDSHLVLSGNVSRTAGRFDGSLTVDLDQVAFADLSSLWPPDAVRNARTWITENITGGTARNGHVVVQLQAPADDLPALSVTGASARIRGEDATVWWLRPVPPVEHTSATLTLTDPDAIDILIDPAPGPPTESTPAGKLTVNNGSVRLTGLAGPDQAAAINLDITGTVPATIALLRHPRLRLLSKHPPPFGAASGNTSAHFGITVPLKHDADFDDIPVRVDARLTRLRLADIVAHKDLTDGDLRMQVTNDGMDLSGRATVAGLPGTLRAGLDFRAGPPTQVLQSVGFDTRPTAAQLEAAGAPVSGLLTGTPAISLSYSSRRNGAGEVSATADLLAAGVDVLGWRKAPGAPARLETHVVLDHDRLRTVDVLRAEGPDLSVQGRAEMAAPGRPAVLVVDGARIGRTRLSGRVGFGPTLTISANGPVLDVGSLLDGSGGGSSPRASSGRTSPGRTLGGGDKPGPAFVVDAAFGQVLLGEGRSLGGVSAHADSDGRTLRHATVQTTGPERLVASLRPEGRGRVVTARTADGGALLRALNLSDRFETGPVALDGRFDDTLPDSPLTGTLEVGRLHLLGAPALGKVLQALTIYGIADAMRGPGLVFSRLEVPFLYADRRLDVRDARLVSSSLGITASGAIDLRRRLVDVKGTVVPAYAVNTAPGRIPVIGRLFTAGPGGGLFAAAWTVTGSLDDPSVSVNPLTLLAPGRLRRLFGTEE